MIGSIYVCGLIRSGLFYFSSLWTMDIPRSYRQPVYGWVFIGVKVAFVDNTDLYITKLLENLFAIHCFVVSMFPRDVADTITVDGEGVEVRPSGVSGDVCELSDEFREATICTHCRECFEKQELSYSDRFPSLISFRCSQCDEKNVVTEASESSSLRSERVVSRLKRRVYHRESRLLGMKNPDAWDKSKRRKARLENVLETVGAAVLLLFLPYFWLNVVGFVISIVSDFSAEVMIPVVLFSMLFIFPGGIVISGFSMKALSSILHLLGIYPQLPEDEILETIHTQSFVSGVRDGTDCLSPSYKDAKREPTALAVGVSNKTDGV